MLRWLPYSGIGLTISLVFSQRYEPGYLPPENKLLAKAAFIAAPDLNPPYVYLPYHNKLLIPYSRALRLHYNLSIASVQFCFASLQGAVRD